VVDCLAIRRGAAAGDAAQTRSHHQLLRLVRCEAGQVEVAVEFAPRFDYGLTTPSAWPAPSVCPPTWTAGPPCAGPSAAGSRRPASTPATGAFTQAFGSPALDAANLLLPLVGFLPPDDPRIRATVERTARELAPHGLVHRYLGADDGLPGGEASFVIWQLWLVDNLALAGQTDHATAMFERLLGHANDLGLLAEQIDPASGQLLGTFRPSATSGSSAPPSTSNAAIGPPIGLRPADLSRLVWEARGMLRQAEGDHVQAATGTVRLPVKAEPTADARGSQLP
jgi:hypothetical protein